MNCAIITNEGKSNKTTGTSERLPHEISPLPINRLARPHISDFRFRIVELKENKKDWSGGVLEPSHCGFQIAEKGVF
jgi:hypothetical protein